MERENWNAMLDELLRDESDTMTAWEVEFIESLDKQRSRNSEDWTPSAKQCGILSEIWDKVFR